MKKLVLLFITFLIFSHLESVAQIVVGKVEYNQEIAREEVFREKPDAVSFELIKSRYIDKEREYNLAALKNGNTKLGDREIGEFSDGTYGIMFYDDPEYYWFYSERGKLISFTKKSSLDYPIKITRYATDGSVINTGLKVSKEESYIFNSGGKLIAHWKGNLCFDDIGNIILTRKLIKTEY